MLLPLEHYKKLREVKPPERSDSSNCRNGYSVPVVKYWGPVCAYCGKDLAESYGSWLDVSVDHVVPGCAVTKWGGEYANWIGALVNLVPCCRSCNEFLNGYRVKQEAPADETAFLSIRDEVLMDKRERALKRHDQERLNFERWLERVQAEKFGQPG